MIHFSIFLSFLSFVGMSNIIRQLINKEFELTYYYACLLGVFVLYFSGLLNILEPAVLTLKAVGLCGCFLFFNRKFLDSFKISYGLIFIVSSILFLYWNVNTVNYAYYSGVDDYSHWGRMMMLITSKNTLVNFNDTFATNAAKDYPPAIALFQYMYSYFSGYQRNIGTFGQSVLTLAALSVLFISIQQKFSQKNLILFLVLALFIGSMIWIFGSGFHSLQADLLLGSTMGVSLFIYYSYKKEGDVKAILLAAPAILSLVLIKHIGILFAGFTLAVIAADSFSYSKKHFFRSLICILSVLIGLLILRYTWVSHVLNSGISISHSPRITSYVDVIRAFIPAYMTDFQATVIKNYISYLFLNHHSSTYWFFGSLLLTFTSFKIAKTNAFEIPRFSYICFYLCFAAYLFVMLILYLFAFPESEGIGVASATRYIKTMSLAMLIYFAGILIVLLDKAKLNLNNKILTVITFLLLILPNFGRILMDSYASFMNRPTQMEAYELEKIAEYTVARTPLNSKIYFIWIDKTLDNSVFFRYGIFPRTSNEDCASIKPIGSPKTERDPSACYWASEEFEAVISSYDFIYLAFTTDEFVEKYFRKLNAEDPATGLYKIIKTDGKISLLKK